MRDLLLIAVAVMLLGAAGCASEEENRRQKLADQNQMWEGVDHMPDKILQLGEYAPQAPAASATQTAIKAPTATPAVVQVSGQATPTPDDSNGPSYLTPDRTHGGVR